MRTPNRTETSAQFIYDANTSVFLVRFSPSVTCMDTGIWRKRDTMIEGFTDVGYLSMLQDGNLRQISSRLDNSFASFKGYGSSLRLAVSSTIDWVAAAAVCQSSVSHSLSQREGVLRTMKSFQRNNEIPKYYDTEEAACLPLLFLT
ncbi:uncharacterized protein LOC111253437 isoform X1 [Varroa destructor]|uniref:Uncharacterized protein n=1 Tax=Varroa destructor TaxID=109461 RepID=A0A7M7MIU9_VARDE|nr:uncharacterized protein LOC111253437 isoform X1 [Varroa destructor]